MARSFCCSIRLLLLISIYSCFIYSTIVKSHQHTHGDHGHGHGHGHDHPEDQPSPSFKYSKEANTKKATEEFKKTNNNNNNRLTGTSLWLSALGSTAAISAAPVLILFFIPIDGTAAHDNLLKVLLAFASGGLLGDAFLHLIPHAIMSRSGGGGGADSEQHSHSHSHNTGGGGESSSSPHSHDNWIGLWILAGIVSFLCVEKFVRIVKGGEEGDGHQHSHSHSGEKNASPPSSEKKKKEKVIKKETKKDIKVSGYLNLAADFAHNFTDGLAIGASFLAGQQIGIITTITIFFHEIPHEIGDFAILIQSGHTKHKAMCLQLVTALGAMTGTVCSLLAEGLSSAAVAWILPFTAGGFIYIATVSVIPELLRNSSVWQTIKEIFALIIGIVMMLLIAEYE